MLLLLVIVVIGLLLYWSTRNPHGFPPGPKWWPVLGCALEVRSAIQECGYFHAMFSHFSKQYGNVYGIKMGEMICAVVNGPEAAKEVLGKEEFDGRPATFTNIFRNMGEKRGVILTDGHLWQEQRRFSLRNLRDFGFGKQKMEELIMNEVLQTLETLKKSAKSAEKSAVQMDRFFNIPVLSSLWAMSVGQTLEHDDPRLIKLMELLDEFFRKFDMSGSILNFMPILRFVAPEMTGYNALKSCRDRLWEYFQDLVNDHKATYSDSYARDLTDVFLKQMKDDEGKETTFTEYQLLALLMDLFMAGSETTSNTLNFAILYMMLNPEIQRKVQEELDMVIGRNRFPTLEDRKNLPYVDAVIMEIQRMGSVVPIAVPHCALRDGVIQGYRIPKDTIILINLQNVHMDKKHWKDPEVFRPERFLNDSKQLVPDEFLIPFGAYRRRCMGETLARNSLFLFFSTIMQSFSFSYPKASAPPTTDPQDGITLSPKPFKAIVLERA